jgi:DNA repair protein RadC
MTAFPPDGQYRTTVRDLPSDDRPRERLLKYGAVTLQTAELLAIILRAGTRGENAIELAARLLREHGGLGGLLSADTAHLCAARGMGEAKTAQLKAALELGRRLSVLTSDVRPRISSPSDVFNLMNIEMGYLAQEQLRVLCLDSYNEVGSEQSEERGTP